MDDSIFGLAPRRKAGKQAFPNAWLTITPLGGFGEIGMNCMVWSTPQSRVVVDCGLMFPRLRTGPAGLRKPRQRWSVTR